jgi:NAD+ kinase
MHLTWFIKPDASADLLQMVSIWQSELYRHDIFIADEQHSADALVSVGGDGTLLHAARVANTLGIPVFGVNQGHLGFLTTIQSDEIVSQLIRYFQQGEFISETRMMLLATLVDREQRIVRQSTAFNDVVLRSADHLLSINWSVDHAHAATWRADGLIISSPTGSTAYNLSAGGPLLEPDVEAMVVSPMNPQTLTNRSLVVSSKRTLSFSHTNPVAQRCSLDGHEVWWMGSEHTLTVSSCGHVTLLHPKPYSFYHVLRRKLGWNDVDTIGLPKVHT